jgi:hypothetical protein
MVQIKLLSIIGTAQIMVKAFIIVDANDLSVMML